MYLSNLTVTVLAVFEGVVKHSVLVEVAVTAPPPKFPLILMTLVPF